MQKKKPIIMWQKWVDPFGNDMEESEWTNYDSDNSIKLENLDNIDEHTEESIEEIKNHLNKKSQTIKVIASPMGLIPYSEHTAAGKIFNFWTGHTNFNLSKMVIDCIEHVDGVETLDIFTRYRFRIAIGKCFSDSETMSNIDRSVYELLESTL